MSVTITAPRRLAVGLRPAARRDGALAVVALAGSLAQLAHGGLDPVRTGWGAHGLDDVAANLDLPGVVLGAFSTLPLVAWRRSPLGVLAATAAASVLLAGLDYPLDLTVGPAVVLYLLAASREPSMPWTRGTTVAVAGLFVAYLGAAAAAQGAFPGAQLLHSGLAWAVAWFAGERTRLRRERLAELQERARLTEREAERERLLSVAEERSRIARDLHDSAGHAITVIAVRAGAARLRHQRDPDHSLSALEAIEQLARQTAEEIDQIVGTLRDGRRANGAVEAPPGLASLDTLIAHRTAAGLEVGVERSGTPRPLGDTADRAAYRILQEALTNAARHGAGPARVRLAYGDGAIELTVTNPAPGADAAPADAAPAGNGHGLIGMRERASLLGGDLQVERRDGIFRVRARIPYGAAATCPGS